MKMLTGPKGESLLDLLWHPVRATILSVSNGVVNIWMHKQKELWSAYAPNFKELDENEEYEERESEFDVEDEDKSDDGRGQLDNTEESNINIISTPEIPAFCSSDEDSEDPLDWLPFAPEVDEPDEPGWGQLEPTLNELSSNEKTPPKKRKAPPTDENKDPSITRSPESKKLKIIDIDLPEASPGIDDSKGTGKKSSNKDSNKTKK